MKTVLEEVASDTVDAMHAQRRVDDREQRLKALYAAIAKWLPADWNAHSGEPVLMHEKMMQEFGLTNLRPPGVEGT